MMKIVNEPLVKLYIVPRAENNLTYKPHYLCGISDK